MTEKWYDFFSWIILLRTFSVSILPVRWSVNVSIYIFLITRINRVYQVCTFWYIVCIRTCIHTFFMIFMPIFKLYQGLRIPAPYWYAVKIAKSEGQTPKTNNTALNSCSTVCRHKKYRAFNGRGDFRSDCRWNSQWYYIIFLIF